MNYLQSVSVNQARASLFVSTDWVSFVLRAQTVPHRGPLLIIHLFLEQEKESAGSLVNGVAVRFTCSLEAAEEFGKTLMQECDAAEHLRTEKGIPNENVSNSS